MAHVIQVGFRYEAVDLSNMCSLHSSVHSQAGIELNERSGIHGQLDISGLVKNGSLQSMTDKCLFQAT